MGEDVDITIDRASEPLSSMDERTICYNALRPPSRRVCCCQQQALASLQSQDKQDGKVCSESFRQVDKVRLLESQSSDSFRIDIIDD